LVGGFDVVVPEILVESELRQMLEQMKADIARMGLKFEDYLKHLAKTEEDLKKEWRKDALKRAKLDLAVAHIAKTEKISPDAEKIELEVKHAKEHYKEISEDRARGYFAHVFLNQAVFEFLEKQK
jgi:trigger factor